MRPRFKLRRLRTVQLTVVTTMLVLPASAFALAGATASERSSPAAASRAAALPVRVSPRHVSFGDPVTITGRTAATQAGRTVVLEVAPDHHAAWRRLARTRIGARGRFAFRAHPRHSGMLRVVELSPASRRASSSPGRVSANVGGAAQTSRGAAQTSGGAAAARRAVSRATPVEVAAQLRVVTHREHQVLAGDDLHVAGRVLPATGGRTVSLQGRSARGWRTLARARTTHRGGFGLGYRPSGGFDRRLRVVFAGDRANTGSVASAGTMTVFAAAEASWYYDAGQTGCGFHAGLGVANKSLPCGTRVEFRNGPHTVTATVDDRGPYVGSRVWDFNQATAAALGFVGVGTVWASVR